MNYYYFLKSIYGLVHTSHRFPIYSLLQDERSYRIARAAHLSMNKIVLPKDQWTSFEENEEKGKYLLPYLDDVRAESEEAQKWDNL